MSAWTVSKAHIDVLVNSAAKHGLVTATDATDMGRMLWLENFRSVNYRYREDETPPGYVFTATEAPFEPAAVLNLIGCYEYQTCEHPEWEASEAAALCTRLRKAIEATLPTHLTREVVGRFGDRHPAYYESREYDAGPWGVDSLDEVPLRL